jgi:nitrous oxidase accessory protein
MTPFFRSVTSLILHGFFLTFITVTSLHARDIVVPTDYSTIQAAVEKAEQNDTVIVEDGTYRENIVINRPLKLISRNGYEKTVIEARTEVEDVIKVVEVDGMTIIGFTVKGTTQSGIHLHKVTGSSVIGNNSMGNYNGLFLENSESNTVSENVSDKNEQGIYLYYSHENVIEKNSASKNADKGILLHASHRNIVSNNAADANYWNGITLSSSNNNSILDNSVVSNSYAIVISDSMENELVNNNTMRRLHFILPVVLVYLGISLYLIEKRLLVLYYKEKSG